jgi:hypothetical protein
MDHLAWLSTYVRLQARDEWAERGNDRRVAQELNHSSGEAIRSPSGGHLRAAVEGVATFGKALQKDAPTDGEEIQEGQSRNPVHVAVSVSPESQLRHENAEKVNSESGHLFHTQP